jgi:hypothetical protein
MSSDRFNPSYIGKRPDILALLPRGSMPFRVERDALI